MNAKEQQRRGRTENQNQAAKYAAEVASLIRKREKCVSTGQSNVGMSRRNILCDETDASTRIREKRGNFRRVSKV